MQQPIAYQNGHFIPQDEMRIAPQDLGFMWGVTVAEQLRTFRGELFQLDEHLARLRSGLLTVGVDVAEPTIRDAAKEVIAHNFALIDSKSDLGLTIFVTPGVSSTYSPGSELVPFVGVHSYPLPFSLWANKYAAGQVCTFSSVPQVSAACWPRKLKARSRMHYYLADQEARAANPAARAILLDADGNINEASTANVAAYFRGEGLVSPPLDAILPGISLRYLESLARELGEPFCYRNLTAQELTTADEVFLTSTPFCMLPVSQMDERKISERNQFDRLLARWSERVGFDIPRQAMR